MWRWSMRWWIERQSAMRSTTRTSSISAATSFCSDGVYEATSGHTSAFDDMERAFEVMDKKLEG